MEKYVEIRIAAHKLCDSSHNFMDRGIKRGKAAHTNTVISVSTDCRRWKGRMWIYSHSCCCKEKFIILHTTKKTFGGTSFLYHYYIVLKGRKYEVIFGGNMSY